MFATTMPVGPPCIYIILYVLYIYILCILNIYIYSIYSKYMYICIQVIYIYYIFLDTGSAFVSAARNFTISFLRSRQLFD